MPSFGFARGWPTGQISATAEKRLHELERKFPDAKPEPPPGIIAGAITSPISVDSARRMSDADWLRAIAKHRERWRTSGRWTSLAAPISSRTCCRSSRKSSPSVSRNSASKCRETRETYVEYLPIGLLSRAETQRRLL